MGLSVVKAFAELMGGSVELESALGQGATFTVRIPARAADFASSDAADQPTPAGCAHVPDPSSHGSPAYVSTAAGGNAPRVLVAEDNGELRHYLADLLGREFQVATVSDGQTAYDVIRAEHPDVVVSDVMMPGMDGFDLVAKLKGDAALAVIPVLLLTARAGADAAADALNRGADDYLSKPFSPVDLMARVRAAHRMQLLNRGLLDAERRASESDRREALEKARAEMSKVSRVAALSALTASIAHEVNQPLAAVVANASACLRWLALKEPNVEEAREAASQIIADGHRASEVIMRLRALFKGAGSALEPLDLNGLVQEVVGLAWKEVRDNGVDVRTELAGELPRAMGDPVQLRQVVLNLVLNATEALGNVLDRPRRIVIATRMGRDSEIEVSVSDSGPGLAPECHARAFEAFFTTKSRGMGLGLSICRSMLENMGGRIWVESTANAGATFAFAIASAGALGAKVA